ncbi:abortive infection family protein [Pseudomonas sp. CCI1.2]|uniref:abortive infection family protein n=1 Tax=unclassified Pseudomonas TaxID=196821 RepID=UPI002AC98E32|nr:MULTISPECIES: abortive infection family protein [unclassified Pseudomonas]MEB0093219.1 abortive infection family protein [Pseudomonas sp. CCI4.2]MEB0123979.1 abortive infection family protein [Pseudomonas sp. CCI1.2]WPX55656.1 abortive infection family protein [Pseudomonas sp. CCI4.2]
MHPLSEEAESLQNILVSQATGGKEDDTAYLMLRRALLDDPTLATMLPRFVNTCRSLSQFWQYIKNKYGTYAERRAYLWDQFRPLLDYVEKGNFSPADDVVTGAIERFDSENVRTAWTKSLERRTTDPEGAITMARTLLESVCKHILEEAGAKYEETPDLNKLYRQTAEQLNLAPSQHTEKVFKQILGGCTSVVEGLGALRNRLSDSHGTGKAGVKPAPRHAELAVNLAGSLALYLLSTWEAKAPLTD